MVESNQQVNKVRKWYILETNSRLAYQKQRAIFEVFDYKKCLIDTLEEAKELSATLRKMNYQTEVMPYDIEYCNSSDFGTLGAYFEADAAHKKIADLEHQLVERDKEIEAQTKFIIDLQKEIKNYRNKLYNFDLDTLKGKKIDKESYLKGFANCEKQFALQMLDIEEDLRHQICEELRKTFDNEDYILYGDNHKILSIHEDEFNEKLTKIENSEL